jgi:ribosomal protein L11 methyltransferase
MPLYSLSLSLPASLSDEKAGGFASAPCGDAAIGEALQPVAGTASREGDDHRGGWRLQWLFEEAPDKAAFAAILEAARLRLALDLPSVTINDLAAEILPDRDWLAESYRRFEPFSDSGFYIYGSHTGDPQPGGDLPLLIDAATAFGSGQHGTTAGCLGLLQNLKAGGFTPALTLDLGTGSGILAVASWRLWGMPVIATDIDPEAVRVAARHRDMNGIPADGIACIESEGFAADSLKQPYRFDLTIANILAGPLKDMAAAIAGVTRPGGFILLSGMLAEQKEDVLARYSPLGCVVAATMLRGDWASVLLEKI